MPLINQPFDGQLGSLLIEKLGGDYNRLTIVVAFAKNSGVLRLKPYLEKFKANGGTIHVFVGVDMQGTSYEALKNLLPICNSLYVVHSEDSSTTFHSKIYLLENDEKVWMAVGSNNLTGGGLWTNFESYQSQEYHLGTSEYDAQYIPFSRLIAKFSDVDYECSRKINNQDDIDRLLSGYLTDEVKQQLFGADDKIARKMREDSALFGRTKRAGLPKLPSSNPKEMQIKPGKVVHPIYNIEETNNNERIWLETREMTGGSRNILDLSKIGTITSGTGNGSRYETDDPRYILGSVSFFDIRPEDTAVSKDITINYNGADYSVFTIFIETTGVNPNGSWRIRMNGVSSGGNKFHDIHGRNWLQHKILVFEKIQTDYYALSVLHENAITQCQLESYVVASNGIAPNSKKYGLLNS